MSWGLKKGWLQSCGWGALQLETAPPSLGQVVLDATSNSAIVSSAQTISVTMTVSALATAMLIGGHFGYSGHTGFGLTWTVGATVQTMGVTPNFDFILTSDNGAAAPADAKIGLLNPTPGAGTLTMSFSSTSDAMLLEAKSFIGADTLRGLSGAFSCAKFGTGTSNLVSIDSPIIPGGIQVVYATGISGTPAGSWNAGTTTYSKSSGGVTWGASAYQSSTVKQTFTLGIGSSVLWCASMVVVNAPSVLPSGSVAINSSNPISSGLTAAIVVYGNSTLTDLISAKIATPVGCTTDLSGGFGCGMAVPGSSTSAKADFGAFQPFPDGDWTYLVVANPPASGVQGVLVGQCDSGVAGFICCETNTDITSGLSGSISAISFNGAVQGASDLLRGVSGGTYHVGKADSNYHAFLGCRSGTTGITACDGADTTLHTNTVGSGSVNGSQHFAIGNLGNYTGGAFSANATLCLALVWNRTLSADERASMGAQPFQLFFSDGFLDTDVPSLSNRPTFNSGSSTLSWVGPSGGGVNNGSPIAQSAVLSNSSITISSNNQVVQHVNCSGAPSITSSVTGWTIRQSRINLGAITINSFGLLVPTPAEGGLIEDCEIFADGVTLAGGVALIEIGGGSTSLGNFTLRRCNIHDTGQHGIEVSNGPNTGKTLLIQDNFIWNIISSNTSGGGVDHFDGIYYGGGDPGQFTIDHNCIINENPQTAAIFCETFFGNIQNLSITNNWNWGGSYPMYLATKSGGTFQVGSVTVTNNKFGGGSNGPTGVTGVPNFPFSVDPTGFTHSGNVNLNDITVFATGPSVESFFP